jgi:putative ABC transport system substrate-binding protein
MLSSGVEADMRRREFIAGLGGAMAMPLAGRAQDRVRRVSALMAGSVDNPQEQSRIEAFRQALEALGWTGGRNLQIDIRWGADDVELFRRHAIELVAATPDVILGATNQALAALRQATRNLPIVFVIAIDPVGDGSVTSLARPGGNATGFLLFEYSISGKWLELLKEVAPGVTRVAVLRDPTTPVGIGQFAAIQAVAPPFRVELSLVNVREGSEIERATNEFAREPNGGLIVTASLAAARHHKLIATLAARHQLPAVYAFRERVVDGGLISYGPDLIDQYRSAANYVDRILKGEKPADLPVQVPTKYQLAINLKTANALGLTLPPSLLARADELIE